MQNKNTNKIVLGAIIGGLVGGSLYYFLHRGNHKPLLNKIGQAISDMGDIVEESRVDNTGDAIEEIEKTIPKADHVIHNVLTWVATGISLWHKFKKGN